MSEEYCNNCGMPGHTTHSCPNISAYQEQSPMEVNAMNGPRGQNSHRNAYNPKTRLNHLGFSWRNDSTTLNPSQFQQQQYQGNRYQVNQGTNFLPQNQQQFQSLYN